MKKIISLLLFSIIMCISAVGCSAAEGNSGNASDFIPNPNVRQTIYFWDEGNMPTETEYTVNNGSYSDPPEFRPYMIFVPAAEGTEIKGAVMINPGGAFQFRSDAEGLPVAEELSKYGYQCFVVNYRLRPYTQEEGALDLARGVRFVRKHADIYGINPNNIASIGFSAGGILSGELALNFDGLENGTKLDTDYIPDELDNISADVSAEGMFYSFYGRLSVASTNKETLAAGNLPPTYFCYGSNEVFRSQIENQIGILDEIGAKTDVNMLEGYNHGFGARGNWAAAFDKWLDGVFAKSAVTGIEISSARINGNKLDYSVAVQGDKSNANIILALYDENTVLCNVQVNKTEGAFNINPYSKYTLKLFAWEKGTMKPLTDSKTIENLGGSQLTQYLNNTISGTDGDIHYTYYLPEDYDENKSYPLLMTLPGYSSLFNTITTTPLTSNPYADANAKSWTRLAGDMIIVSPSLTDWGDKSARQTIELTDYFIDNFSVDERRIYAAGHSAGGETLSRAVDMRPDLFAAYLHIASQWDGGYNNITAYKLPVYIFMGETDEYYGADKAIEPYNSLYQKYVSDGLSDDEINNLLVLDLRDNEYFVSHGFNNQHAGGQLAGNDADIIKWMLSHAK